MFALCCMKLGRYLEAEKALEAEDCPVCSVEARIKLGYSVGCPRV